MRALKGARLTSSLAALALGASCGGGSHDPDAGARDAGRDRASEALADAAAGGAQDADGASGEDALNDVPADVPFSSDGSLVSDGPSRPSDGPSAPSSCYDNWSTIYASAPGELAPTRGDLSWQGGTLYVTHSSTQYAWVFSLPDHGGAKNPLYEGHLRGDWLEGDRLLYAQNYDLFNMPRAGGPPTKVLHYGDKDYDTQNGDSLGQRSLDRAAIYWLFPETSLNIFSHSRAGGADTTLASIPSATTNQRGILWMRQAKGRLVLSMTAPPVGPDAGKPFAASVSKTGGDLAALPTFGLSSTLLATSNDGALLWTRRDLVQPPTGGPFKHSFSYGLADLSGTTPAAFSTPIPPSSVPLDAWAAGDGAWYVTTSELDVSGAAVMTIWYVASSGAAFRLACDPLGGPPDANGNAPSKVTAGVAADGAFFASVQRPGGAWQVVRAENPGAHTDTGDVGAPAGDGGAGGAGGTTDVGCPSLPGTGGAGGSGTITEFLIPGPSAIAQGIAPGPDGALYFGEAGKKKIGRITTDGCISELPVTGVGPASIIVGPDKFLWFSDDYMNIGRVLQDGSLMRLFYLAPADMPTEITFGKDGNIWYGNTSPAEIVRLMPGGMVTTFPMTFSLSAPRYAVAAPDGNVWFAETNNRALAHIDPAGGPIVELPLPSGAPGALVLGPDSNLWVIVNRSGSTASSSVSRVTTAGTFTDFPLPAGAGPTRLCAGPDGNVWVAENSANKIARLVPSTGIVTEYPLSVIGATFTGLAAGPDGNIWFIEGSANRIGRLHP